MSTSTPLKALPLCVDAGAEVSLSTTGRLVGARVGDCGIPSVVVEFVDAASAEVPSCEAVGVGPTLAVVLLSVIVTLGGLTVIVDRMKVVDLDCVPALSLSLGYATVLLSSEGMIQNSADTNPPLIRSSSSPSALVALTSQGTLQSPRHCTVHS